MKTTSTPSCLCRNVPSKREPPRGARVTFTPYKIQGIFLAGESSSLRERNQAWEAKCFNVFLTFDNCHKIRRAKIFFIHLICQWVMATEKRKGAEGAREGRASREGNPFASATQLPGTGNQGNRSGPLANKLDDCKLRSSLYGYLEGNPGDFPSLSHITGEKSRG